MDFACSVPAGRAVGSSAGCSGDPIYESGEPLSIRVCRDELERVYKGQVLYESFGNLISPTNGLLLAGLAIARIRFGQWFRVIFPFFLIAWPIAAILALISAFL